MNGKKKLVMVVLVLMMMVTAVAYAAWSDTIEVNGTVTTGTFDVWWNAGVETSAIPSGNADATHEIARRGTEDDVFDITIKNAKPKDSFTYKLTAENLGSVHAQRKSVKIGSTEVALNDAISGTPITLVYGNTAINVSVTFDSDTLSLTPFVAGAEPGTGEGGKGDYTITVSIPDTYASRNNADDSGFGYDTIPAAVDFMVQILYTQANF